MHVYSPVHTSKRLETRDPERRSKARLPKAQSLSRCNGGQSSCAACLFSGGLQVQLVYKNLPTRKHGRPISHGFHHLDVLTDRLGLTGMSHRSSDEVRVSVVQR